MYSFTLILFNFRTPAPLRDATQAQIPAMHVEEITLIYILRASPKAFHLVSSIKHISDTKVSQSLRISNLQRSLVFHSG